MKGDLLNKMLVLATVAHRGQLDKSGQPYILHPIAVMHLLYTTDEELQCIALGHDLIEDTDVTLWQLMDMDFTPRIVDAINMLSRIDGEPYATYKLRVKSNPDAVRVKLADLQHNLDPTRAHVISRSLHKRYTTFYQELQALL